MIAPAVFPLPLDAYAAPAGGLVEILRGRIQADPFNLVATVIFLLAILHTFMAGKIQHLAHEAEVAMRSDSKRGRARTRSERRRPAERGGFKGQLLHFFGEIEAIFGIWAVILALAIVGFKGGATALHAHRTDGGLYRADVCGGRDGHRGHAAGFVSRRTRAPGVASLGKGRPVAWWLAILILAPLFGSFIAEPAAMTIAALLLGNQFYALKPSPKLKYATLGLLFVNILVGGTLRTLPLHPCLMVAGPWKWDFSFMLEHFGWKAAVGIVVRDLGLLRSF